MRYIAAVLSFLLMWFFVGILCSIVMGLLFPGGGLIAGGIIISPDWRTWPGFILGVLAGIHSAKAALNPKPKKSKNAT
ncbi:MAG: hypothetical protein M3347_00730, partial [Armatimonadota bacterium]|nr:hypothetical protein [Armatimonadota bacterium]